jgi:SSS family solute:Na+ symporter
MPVLTLLPCLIYFAALAAITWHVMRNPRIRTSADYFLARRSVGPFALGLSLFVTTLSAEWVLGAAGVSGWVALIAGGGISMAVWILAPKLLASRPFTLPQFVGWRFDQRTGLMLSGASIVFTLGVRIPLILLMGSSMIHQLTGFDPATGSILLLLAAGCMVIAGGFGAMVAGHVLQGAVAFAGAAGLAAWMFLGTDFPLQAAGPEHLQVLDLPWPVTMAAAMVIATWYWTGDHFVVQRMLAARDLKSVGRGALLAAILVVGAAPFVFPLPLQEVGTPALPPIAAGLFALVIIAVVMAALSGYVHSAASLLTMDFFLARHPSASERRLVRVGRITSGVFVLIGVLFAAGLGPTSTALVVQRLQLYLAGPAAALMIAVLFSKRTIARGAVTGLVAGGLIEAAHAIAWLAGPGSVLDSIARVDTVYAALAAFAVTLSATFLGGSPATAATPAGITAVPRPGGTQ